MWSSDDGGGDDSDEERIPSRNRPKNGSNDDNLYGVFAEDNEDDQTGFSLKRSRGGSSLNTTNKSAKLMSFVAAPTNQTDSKKDDDGSEDGSDDDEEKELQKKQAEHEDMFRQTLGFSGSFGSNKHKKKENDGVVFESGNKSSSSGLGSSGRPSAPKAEGAWEKHTKGFGMKMLMKLGYKGGGLGKEGKGISRHVEVAGPRGTEGLGAVKESTNLKANKIIQRELTGKFSGQNNDESEDDEDDNRPRKNRHLSKTIAEKTAESSLWRRDASAVSKKKKKNEYSLSRDAFTVKKSSGGASEQDQGHYGSISSGGSGIGLVVDMRAAQTKVLSSTAELSLGSGVPEVSIKTKQLGSELLHNLDLHVNLTEGKARDLETKLANEIEHRAHLKSEVDKLSIRVNQGKQQFDRFLDIQAMLSTLETSSDPLDIIEVFQALKSQKYSQEYVLFDLRQLTQTLISPLLEFQLKEWDPLQEPHYAVDLLKRWKPLLKDDEEDDHRMMQDSRPWNHQFSSAESLESLESAEIVVMRKIRSCISGDWDVVSDANSCVELIESISLSCLFSAAVIDDLLKTTVFPKIKRVVDTWVGKIDNASYFTHQTASSTSSLFSNQSSRADVYLHPWLPFLAAELATLFPCVRKKLLAQVGEPGEDAKAEEGGEGGGLEQDGRSRDVMVSIVQSWLVMFDEKSQEQFSTQVGIKLSTLLKTSFVINPASQSLKVINNVLAWSKLLPLLHLKCFFRGEFFPMWNSVLYDWLLQSTPDSSANKDIIKWYKGWKKYLTSQHEELGPLIQGDLGFALDIMKVCRSRQMSEQGDPSSSQLPLKVNFMKNTSYMSLLRTEVSSSPPHSDHSVPSSQKSTAASNQHLPQYHSTIPSSFKEVVAAYAESKGIEFMIKIGRMFQGRQLYSFGSHSIYFDNDVVHVDKGVDRGGFVPIGLEELA